MATLTVTSYYARRAVKFGSLGFVVLLVLWFVVGAFIAWWRATYPPPPPPPTVDFGVLPAIKFPKSVKTGLEFELQTPTGQLGQFPDRMRVFYAPVKQSGFLDPDRAIDLARRLDFLFDPVQPSETTYLWTKSDPLPTSLQVDIVSGNFKLKRQWQADPSLIVNKRFISGEQAILDAQTYLRQVGISRVDLAGSEKLSYWRAQGDRLIPALSLSEADFVRVDLFRSNYQVLGENKQMLAQYGFYTPDPAQGLVSVLLSGSPDRNKQVIELDYHYHPVLYEESGTYPLKTAAKAYEELTAGEGMIASFTGPPNRAVIRRVVLGYFDSSDQEYAMPIYVFTGDDSLVAYISAQ